MVDRETQKIIERMSPAELAILARMGMDLPPALQLRAARHGRDEAARIDAAFVADCRRLRKLGAFAPAPHLYKHRLAGRAFGRWTVLHEFDPERRRAAGRRWVCVCACGTQRVVNQRSLVRRPGTDGYSTSCGCRKDEVTGDRSRKHGYSRTPTYRAWIAMRRRCTMDGQRRWARQDPRVRVCPRWMQSFDAFLADVGPCPRDGRRWMLARLDTAGDFAPGNARWTLRSDVIRASWQKRRQRQRKAA
jgi:hypothetical protein